MTDFMSHPEANRYRKLVCQTLGLIPTHRDAALTSREIAHKLQTRWAEQTTEAPPSESEAVCVVYTVVMMLDAWGVLATTGERHQTVSQIPTYFLRSLGWYIEHGEPILTGWQTKGVSQDVPLASLLEHAPHFFKLMEERRVHFAEATQDAASASRHQDAVFILIKGVLAGEVYYLHQFDADAGQFQLIGGRIERSEMPAEAASRELSEELSCGNGALQPERDFDLQLLLGAQPQERITFSRISPTYGAWTHYTWVVFGAMLYRDDLMLSDNDRWISISAMLDDQTRPTRQLGDFRINRAINDHIPGGLRDVAIAAVEIARLSHYARHIMQV